MNKINKVLVGIASLAVTAGMAYAAGSVLSEPQVPAVGRSASRAVYAKFTIPTPEETYIDLT
ncbi:hypothetical protein ED551_13995, partial [Muribaculaceae bacterium Isolate-013 (NCI)]